MLEWKGRHWRPFFYIFVNMNIILLGHDDIASKIALRRIVARLPEHEFRLFLSGPLASRSTELVEPLEELSRLDRAFYESLPWDLDREPEELPAPNSAQGVAALETCDPDLFISVRYRRIFKSAAIEIPRHGVLNLHSGLLPEYKGVMATFWAMLNGEKQIGCTLHWIVDGTIDTGPIIGISRTPTRTDRSYLANTLGLYPAGCDMMVNAVKKISTGETLDAAAQTGAGHYYSKPQPRDLNRFGAQGLRLADANDLADFLDHHE
jgi:methionyl-tRNA formyltransferase